MKYIYILLICLILFYLLSRYFEKYYSQENFDPSLVPVSSIITLAKVAQKIITGNGTLTNPGNLQIGTPSTTGNLTVTGDTFINGTLNTDTNININGNFNINNGNLIVNKNASFGNNLDIIGNTNISGNTKTNTLNVTGDTTTGNTNINEAFITNLTITGVAKYKADKNHVSKDNVIRHYFTSNGDTIIASSTKTQFHPSNTPATSPSVAIIDNNTGSLSIDGTGYIPSATIGNINLPTSTINLSSPNGKVITGNATYGSLTSVSGQYSGKLYIEGGKKIIRKDNTKDTLSIKTTDTYNAAIGCDKLNFNDLNGGNTTNLTINGNLSVIDTNIIPIGAIIMWTGDTSNIPSNCILCDGVQPIPTTSTLYNNYLFPNRVGPNMTNCIIMGGNSGGTNNARTKFSTARYNCAHCHEDKNPGVLVINFIMRVL
jgi:cytoskeletal protein CcmA (bactofilin family)